MNDNNELPELVKLWAELAMSHKRLGDELLKAASIMREITVKTFEEK